jgi:hypothetical protein
VLRTISLSCALLAAVGSQALAANCAGTRVNTLANQTVQGDMFAVSGKPCGRVLLGSRGPTTGVRVLQQPSHGSATVRGLRVVYVSRPGYVGDDRFVFAWEGKDTLNQPRTNTVEMHVRVSKHL